MGRGSPQQELFRDLPKRGRPRIDPSKRRGHVVRPEVKAAHPLHVTLRLVENAPHLRKGRIWRVLEQCFYLGRTKAGFRLVHFSVQGNHLHLVVEADDKLALARGMQGLAIRIARRVNRRVDRKGSLFAARYHARAIKHPTEMRNVLRYVMFNAQKHAGASARYWIDVYSSARWCPDLFTFRLRERWMQAEGPPPVASPTSWLLVEGWWKRGGGRLGPDGPSRT